MSKTSQLLCNMFGTKFFKPQTPEWLIRFCCTAPAVAVESTATGCKSACAAEKHPHCWCLLQICQNNCKQRFLNPTSEMPSLLVRLFWGAKCYCSKDKAYFIFLPRQLPSNRDFLKHITACLADIWSQGWHRLCYSKEKWKRQTALQNKSIAFISSFCWCFGEGRKEERKERKRFSALKVLFSLLFKTPISSSQINGIMHFPIICLR